MFAPGPFTAKGGKRPIISPQDSEFERYLKKEFDGGGSTKDFEVAKKPRVVPRRPTSPKPTPQVPSAEVALEAPSRDLRRTKPSRAPSKA